MCEAVSVFTWSIPHRLHACLRRHPLARLGTCRRSAETLACLLVLAGASVGSGCPHGPNTGRTTVAEIVSSEDPLAENAYERAQEALTEEKTDEARSLLEEFLTRWPDDPLAPPARVSLAWLYLQTNETDRASALLQPALEHPDAVLAERARLYMGVLKAREHSSLEAIELLQGLVGRTVRPRDTTLLLLTLANAHEDLSQPGQALTLYDRLLAGQIDAQTRVKALSGLERAVDALDEGQGLPRAWEELPRDRIAWQKVSIRLLQSAYGASNFAWVATIAEALEEQGANLDEGLRALVLRAERAGSVDPGVIGAILPLSGSGVKVGQSAQLGLMLAAGMPDGQRPLEDTPKVIYRDDRGDPEIAVQMVEELTSLHRVIAIVGPMTGPSARAAGARAQELGVPMIALSSLQDLTTIGDHVFRMMASPDGEAATLVSHAFRNGARRFAILFPSGGYGDNQRRAYARQIERVGGSLVAAQSYMRDTTTFGPILEPLSGLDIDALIITDGPRRLQLLAPALVKQGLWVPRGYERTVSGARQLLLPPLAFSPDLLKTTSRYLQGASFLLTSTPGNQTFQRFSQEFEQTFGKRRSHFAAYAHDAYALIRAALRSGEVRTRDELSQALTQTRAVDTVGSSDGFGSQRGPRQAGTVTTLEGSELVPVQP